MMVLDQLADAAKSALVAAGLVGGNVHRDLFRPVQESEIPIALVAVSKDHGSARGSARTGNTDLNHVGTVGIMVQLKRPAGTTVEDAGERLKADMHAAGQLVLDTLLRSEWQEPLEGIEAVRQEYDFPKDSAGMIGRVIIEIDCVYSSNWVPYLPANVGDFKEVGVTVGGHSYTIHVPQS